MSLTKKVKKRLKPKFPTFETVDVRDELGSIPRQALKQVTGKSLASHKLFGGKKPSVGKKQISPVVEAMLKTSDSSETVVDNQSKKPKAFSRAGQIEAEIAGLRKRRQKRKKEWDRDQEELMVKKKSKEKPVLGTALLPGSPKKGPGAPGRGKGKSLETRKSRH